MYLKKHENITIKITNNHARTRWKKRLGITESGVILVPSEIAVHWTMLRHWSYRPLAMVVQCNGCGAEFNRLIRNLDPMVPIHYCSACIADKTRNPAYKTMLKRKNKIDPDVHVP